MTGSLRHTAKKLLPPRAVHSWRMLLHTRLRMFEPEFAIAQQFLSRDRIAIDAGANVGLYTDLFSRTAKSVMAFEPHPGCAAHLRQLRFPNTAVIEAALSDRAGRAVLRVPTAGGSEAHALSSIAETNPLGAGDAPGAHAAHEVEMTTLDAACAGQEAVGFIKIDVEGHEMAVVRGAERIIDEDRPVLMIEIEVRHGADIPAMLAFFANRDYRAMAATDGATLAHVTPEALAALQTPDRLARKQREPRWTGYVNNVFFIPAERDL